jgi:multicomponent Na+:H+ antiporter subunit C
MTIVLVIVIGVLYGTGAYIMLQRSLTRIVIGLAVVAHGANLLLLLAGGRAGRAPFVDETARGPMSDPLPQALALTAIVIAFGVSAFLLALAYRSWELRHTDEVEDDPEDRRIADRAQRRAKIVADEGGATP